MVLVVVDDFNFVCAVRLEVAESSWVSLMAARRWISTGSFRESPVVKNRSVSRSANDRIILEYKLFVYQMTIARARLIDISMASGDLSSPAAIKATASVNT